jgi:Xaa-Pro aminopeptidase
VGLDGGETGTDILENGSVIAFEPMFSVEEDAYYLEDMILITETGHEVLSKGLPYTAEEIEAVMNR